MTYEYEMIVCVVNTGFSDAVMSAARACGARGGTVINARGTANPEAESFFKITIQPEKEIVIIAVLHLSNRSCNIPYPRTMVLPNRLYCSMYLYILDMIYAYTNCRLFFL